MKEIRTEIIINADAEAVWNALTDFDSYREWNPFVISASIDLKEGGRAEVTLQPPGGKAFAFKPKVISVNAPHEFRWLGHILVPGIMDGQHIFELEPTPDGGTRLIQREEFRGVLTAPFLAWIGKKTEAGFHLMNEAIKERVESGVS